MPLCNIVPCKLFFIYITRLKSPLLCCIGIQHSKLFDFYGIRLARDFLPLCKHRANIPGGFSALLSPCFCLPLPLSKQKRQRHPRHGSHSLPIRRKPPAPIHSPQAERERPAENSPPDDSRGATTSKSRAYITIPIRPLCPSSPLPVVRPSAQN